MAVVPVTVLLFSLLSCRASFCDIFLADNLSQDPVIGVIECDLFLNKPFPNSPSVVSLGSFSFNGASQLAGEMERVWIILFHFS